MKKTMYEVRYVGAPYGANESGELVSRHRSEEAAIAARNRLQSNPRYYGSNTRIVRVDPHDEATTYVHGCN